VRLLPARPVRAVSAGAFDAAGECELHCRVPQNSALAARNAAGLEAAACECLRIIRGAYDQLLA